jgi:hypothetical protein
MKFPPPGGHRRRLVALLRAGDGRRRLHTRRGLGRIIITQTPRRFETCVTAGLGSGTR